MQQYNSICLDSVQELQGYRHDVQMYRRHITTSGCQIYTSGHHIGSPGTNGVAYVSCGLMYGTAFISHFSKAPITTYKLPKCMDESGKH